MFQVIEMPARTLAWWLDQKDDIDFSPVYQRKSRIWSPKAEQFLLDSILNGFDVPKIYLADFTFMNTVLNRAHKKYAVIDGKQRLETIFKFFEGHLTLADDFEFVEDPTLELGGLSFQDLSRSHPKIARKFENHNLTVMSVITNDEAKINDLFVRLNSSRPLTGAELRNAMQGKVPELIRRLVTHDFFAKRIRFNNSRSQDKNLAAKLLLIEHRGQLVDTKKSQLDDLVEKHAEEQAEAQASLSADDESEALIAAEEQIEDALTDSEGGDIERSATRVKDNLDTMSSVFVENDILLASQAPIVPYYWLVREIGPDRARLVRPFLVSFDQKLRHNRALTAGAAGYDVELASFYTMSRTSNDAGSMKGRYRILRARFDAYCEPQLSV